MQSYSKSDILKGLKDADRVLLSKAITFAESRKSEHRKLISSVLEEINKEERNTFRIGITGVPGVGKSTFIETFGLFLIEHGHKVAVLTVDPSSKQSGGSILGDKTRMSDLSRHRLAYIRPSPSGLSLGGVARNTREAMLLCEAAGFDTIIVETVGVGQSETAVSEMVDAFLLLMLSGAGDELQGIKKGIMESADLIAINKCDGDNIKKSREAQAEYRRAIQMFPKKILDWQTQVLTVSSLEKTGLDDIWQNLLKYRQTIKEIGYFEENRKKQLITWLEDEIQNLLNSAFLDTADMRSEMKNMKQKVKDGEIFAYTAAQKLIDRFLDQRT